MWILFSPEHNISGTGSAINCALSGEENVCAECAIWGSVQQCMTCTIAAIHVSIQQFICDFWWCGFRCLSSCDLTLLTLMHQALLLISTSVSGEMLNSGGNSRTHGQMHFPSSAPLTVLDTFQGKAHISPDVAVSRFMAVNTVVTLTVVWPVHDLWCIQMPAINHSSAEYLLVSAIITTQLTVFNCALQAFPNDGVVTHHFHVSHCTMSHMAS
jgi:hypothetical protein